MLNRKLVSTLAFLKKSNNKPKKHGNAGKVSLVSFSLVEHFPPSRVFLRWSELTACMLMRKGASCGWLELYETMAAQGLLDSKDSCTVKQRGGRGAAPELIYHIHHSFRFNFTSPATFFYWWHQTKPCHMTCHITFINPSTIFVWHAAKGHSYFQSCVYVGKREVWKVWRSPLLKKKSVILTLEDKSVWLVVNIWSE